MTPPREVWVVCDASGCPDDVDNGETRAERQAESLDRNQPGGAPHTVTRYVLPPSLLTEAQKEQLVRGIDRSLKRGVKGIGGPLEVLRITLQDIIGPHALMNAHAGGAWMRTLAYWLLAQDDRIRGIAG